MPRPSTHVVPSTSGQQHTPCPEETPFNYQEENDHGMTSTHHPSTSSTFFDLSQPAAEQHGPMAYGYGQGDLHAQPFMILANNPKSIQTPEASTAMVHRTLMSTANASQGFNHLDYDGDSIMDLTPIPESSLNNANAYGGPDSFHDAAWQELGSDYLSSMQGIYDATDSSDILTSQLLPQPQMEAAWENNPSFQTAYPRIWAEQAEHCSYQNAEYDNWSRNTLGMPYPGNAMVNPGTEPFPHVGSPAYVESRQGQRQYISPSSQSSDTNGGGATAKGTSTRRKLAPLLPKAVPLSAALESSTGSTNTPEQSKKELDPLLRVRTLPPARRGGRKGPLHEKATHKQAPKRSTCMRCRKMRIKCFGGDPCVACQNNAKAKLWARPCVKAHFLDIVENGSYFARTKVVSFISLAHFRQAFKTTNSSGADTAVHQATQIEKLNLLSLLPQFVLMKHLASRDVLLHVTNFPDSPLSADCELVWEWGFSSIYALFEHNKGARPEAAIGRQLLSLASRTWASKGLEKFPDMPIIFYHPEAAVPREFWITRCLMFFGYSSPSYQLSVNERIGLLPIDVKKKAVDDAAQTLIWLATRQCEISLFRYLQDVVNNSEPVCAEDTKENALCFLKVLITAPNDARRDVERCMNAKICDRSVDIAVIDDLQDRLNRIRAALFVYTSISISKLPAWSEFWSQMNNYYSFSRETFMASLASLEALDGLLKTRKEQMTTSSARLLTFKEALQAMDTHHDLNESSDLDADSDFDFIESFPTFMKELCDGKVDEMIEIADEEITGGLLLANTPEQVARRRADAFFGLTTFNWEKGLPLSSKETASTDIFFHSKFLALILTRSKAVLLYGAMKEGIEDGVKLGYSESRAQRLIKEKFLEVISPSVAGKHVKLHEMSEEFDEEMRKGARWAELIVLMGVDEILLYDKMPDLLISGSALQTLDIPAVVDMGTDEEFAHLKKLLQSPTHLWVKETCLELRGVLKMIQKAAEAGILNLAESSALARQIEARVTKVFGGHLSFLQRKERKLDPLQVFTGLFLHSISKHHGDGDPQLRKAFAEAGIEAFRATRRERNNLVDGDNNRAMIKCLRKNLRKIVEGTRAGVCEHGAATQQQVDQARRSLSEAIESFILAISISPLSRLLDALDSSNAERTEFRKYLERSAEAFTAAFSIGYRKPV